MDYELESNVHRVSHPKSWSDWLRLQEIFSRLLKLDLVKLA
jgi:hypothetical protein